MARKELVAESDEMLKRMKNALTKEKQRKQNLQKTDKAEMPSPEHAEISL